MPQPSVSHCFVCAAQGGASTCSGRLRTSGASAFSACSPQLSMNVPDNDAETTATSNGPVAAEETDGTLSSRQSSSAVLLQSMSESIGNLLKQQSQTIHTDSAIGALLGDRWMMDTEAQEALLVHITETREALKGGGLTLEAPDYDPEVPVLPLATPSSTTWQQLCGRPAAFGTPCGVGRGVVAFSNGAIEYESLKANRMRIRRRSHCEGEPSLPLASQWEVLDQSVEGRRLVDCNDGEHCHAFLEDEADHDDPAAFWGIFSGMRWECLEYARRSLIAHWNCTFPSMPGASSLWTLESLLSLDGQQRVAIQRFHNGETLTAPSVGDLLVYPRIYPEADVPHGHVAVVVEVRMLISDNAGAGCQGQDEDATPPPIITHQGQTLVGWVCIAEQNWDNCMWSHVRYARRLALTRSDGGGGPWRVHDCRPYYVLGWMRPDVSPPTGL